MAKTYPRLDVVMATLSRLWVESKAEHGFVPTSDDANVIGSIAANVMDVSLDVGEITDAILLDWHGWDDSDAAFARTVAEAIVAAHAEGRP